MTGRGYSWTTYKIKGPLQTVAYNEKEIVHRAESINTIGVTKQVVHKEPKSKKDQEEMYGTIKDAIIE